MIDGVSFTVSTKDFGSNQPALTAFTPYESAIFYDVQVIPDSSVALGSDINAVLYFSDPSYTEIFSISYWNQYNWEEAVSSFVAPDKVGCTIPLSALTGTYFVVSTENQLIPIQDSYNVTVNIVGQGDVSKNATEPYVFNQSVNLTAVPSADWVFSGWSGDLSGSANPSTITINGNKSVIATFTQNTYTLTTVPVGGGSVSLNNTGPYHLGDRVRLTAVPQTGWVFANWGGDLSGSSNPVTITIDANKSVGATFTQNTYTLTITPVGSGSVSLNNTGPYHFGDCVRLTAVPSSGWSFSAWSGSLSGSANPADLTLTSNMAVTATFTHTTFTVSITWIGGASTDWNNPSNWSPNRLPNSSDDVYIPANAEVVLSAGSATINGIDNRGNLTISGSLYITTNSTMAWLTLNGGLIDSTEVMVTDRLVWQAGTIKNCMINIASTAVANISGYNNDQSLDDSTFNNYGVTNLVGSGGYVYSYNGAIFNNYEGAKFNVLLGSGTFYPVFRNFGTVSRLTGGEFTFNGYFENNGFVEVDSRNSLNLDGGGTSSGVFFVGFNSTLSFGGTHDLQEGSLVTGAGNVTFSGNAIVQGTFAVSGAVFVGGLCKILRKCRFLPSLQFKVLSQDLLT